MQKMQLTSNRLLNRFKHPVNNAHSDILIGNLKTKKHAKVLSKMKNNFRNELLHEKHPL